MPGSRSIDSFLIGHLYGQNRLSAIPLPALCSTGDGSKIGSSSVCSRNTFKANLFPLTVHRSQPNPTKNFCIFEIRTLIFPERCYSQSGCWCLFRTAGQSFHAGEHVSPRDRPCPQCSTNRKHRTGAVALSGVWKLFAHCIAISVFLRHPELRNRTRSP